jgi:hypothetical protein
MQPDLILHYYAGSLMLKLNLCGKILVVLMISSTSSSVIGATDTTSLIYIFDDDRLRATPSAARKPASRGSLTKGGLEAPPTASDKTAQPLKEHCRQ